MFLAVASCFAAGCSVNESLENETVTVPAAKILGTPGEDAVKGSILVYLDDDMLARMSSGSVTKGAESDPDFSEIFPGVGIDGARKVFRSIDENNMDKADMSLRHWYKLYFDEGLSLTEVAESLAGLEGVQRVQYNVRIHSDVEPVVYVGASAAGSISSHAAALGQDPLFNDPNLPLQWHYSNDGTVCRAAVAAAALAALSGCKKDDPAAPGIDVSGEWHLQSSDKIDISAEGIDVYVSFLSSGSFEIYQKISDGRYRHYTGTYSATGDHISGTYSNGSAWGSGYTAVVSGETLTLTSDNASKEVTVYAKEEIPAEVKDGAVEVKSAETARTSPWL